MPLTSICTLKLSKESQEVHDGEYIAVISSMFSSIDFVSGAVRTSESFEVPIKTYDSEPVTVFNGQSVILNCSDNDIFNMYITL